MMSCAGYVIASTVAQPRVSRVKQGRRRAAQQLQAPLWLGDHLLSRTIGETRSTDPQRARPWMQAPAQGNSMRPVGLVGRPGRLSLRRLSYADAGSLVMSEPLTLISSMATRRMLAELLADHESSTGEHVIAESVGGVDAARRVLAGEAFDAVLLASQAIEQLISAGCVLQGSRVDVARCGVAVAVGEGAPLPDLSDEFAVRAAVLAAGSVGFSTGPSGTHLLKLFERWGIASAIEQRIVQAPPGTPVGRLVAEGQVELGFQQLSELLHLPGIVVAGPLPAQIQIETTFCAGVCATARDAPRVLALLHWLASAHTRGAKLRHGMDAAS
jgi:molybdate transport system substrate-binding protein